MATWQSIMTNWHCGIMTLWQFLWTVRYFVCTWWNWNPMYILPLYTSKQNTYFENIWPHIYTHWSLTGQCWVNKMKLFHKKALFVSSLGVSLGSAALSLYWRKNVNFEDGDVKEHLSFHYWHLFWLGSWISLTASDTFIFHLPKHMLQYDWKVAPSPASPCQPSWSAAASSASPRRCSLRGAAWGCGCWRSGQVSTVSQPSIVLTRASNEGSRRLREVLL